MVSFTRKAKYEQKRKSNEEIFLGIVISLSLLTGCTSMPKSQNDTSKRSNDWTKYSLIAHAGGGIDDEVYTNSREAMKNSYKQGFRLFEFDIATTSDEKLVARHTWDESLGQNIEGGQPIPYQIFMKDLYFDKFHPLDFKQIIRFMATHPKAYVILDGKVESPEDVTTLYKKINSALKWTPKFIKNRLIPQMFYKSDISTIRGYGFKNVLYVVGREPYTAASLSKFCKENNIEAVSLSVYRSNPVIVKTLAESKIKSYT